MERYLEGEEIDHAEIVTALKRGVTEGHLFPVTCGVASKNLGTNRLLDALVEDLPSPKMRGSLEALGRSPRPLRKAVVPPLGEPDDRLWNARRQATWTSPAEHPK